MRGALSGAANARQAPPVTQRATSFVRTLPKLAAGEYDLFVLFRGEGVRAGLWAGEQLMYRSVSAQAVDAGVSRGFLGRVRAAGDEPINVFVTGQPGALVGLAYAPLAPVR